MHSMRSQLSFRQCCYAAQPTWPYASMRASSVVLAPTSRAAFLRSAGGVPWMMSHWKMNLRVTGFRVRGRAKKTVRDRVPALRPLHKGRTGPSNAASVATCSTVISSHCSCNRRSD